MKMDTEYLREMLLSIQSMETPLPHLKAVISRVEGDFSPSDRFVLHYHLLRDYEFIHCIGHRVGIHTQLNDQHIVQPCQIRLTAKGHEFIEALEKSDIWEIIKKDFKEESIKTIFNISSELAVGFAKKKLAKYLAD